MRQREDRRGLAVELVRTAGLDDEVAARLMTSNPDPVDLTGRALRPLVESGQLSAAQAANLHLLNGIVGLTDGQTALGAVILKAELPGRGEPPRTLRELATLDSGDWAGLITRSGITPPRELSVRGYADTLRTRFERIFPGEALAARLAPDLKHVAEDLNAGKDETARARLRRLCASYPGLGLDQVLADEKLSPRQKVEHIGAGIDGLRRVREANPDVELLALDLAPGSGDLAGLNLKVLDERDRDGVLATLKAHQRVYQLSSDVEDARTLLASGLDSGVAVARLTLQDLIDRTGLPPDVAELHHHKAARMLSTVTGLFGGILDLEVSAPATAAIAGTGTATSPPPGVLDYLRTLDGYRELFGSQAACDCGHCESILGPPAYFADLMLFVQRHVSDSVFAGARAGHPLHLRTRRPDLWTTPLTCQNTSTMIPSLDIINEILENYTATSRGHIGSLADRTAVRHAVYAQALAVSQESLRLPFSLPTQRVRVYLGDGDVTRSDVVLATGAPARAQVAARLELSDQDYHLIVTPDVDLVSLRARYGLPLVPDQAGVVPGFDAQELVRAAEVTREELGALLATRFVGAAGAAVTIRAEKTSAASVQHDVERVHGLTAAALDRLHRLIRLWRSLDWGVGELDLVLTQLAVTTLTPDELALVATLQDVQLRLEIPAAEVCALAGALPRVPAEPGAPSLFDRLFNLAAFVAQDGAYPKDTTTFLHPALRGAATAPIAGLTQHRLQTALGVTESELLVMIYGLKAELDVDPAATDPAARAFTLTAAHLSALYRHARLARLLGLSVVELLRLLSHTPATTPPAADAHRPAAGLTGLTALLDQHRWWSGSGRTLDDLDVLADRAPVDPSRYPDPAALVTGLLAETATEQALSFADTVLGFLDGVTEDSSRAVIAANPTRFSPAGTGRFRLADDFDLDTPLTMPAGVTLVPSDVRDLLTAFHPSAVLSTRLAGRLRLPVETVRTLLELLQADLSAGALPAALHGTASPAALVTLVTELVPLMVLFAPPRLDTAAVGFIAAHPATVGLTDPRHIGMATVRALTVVTAAGPDATALDALEVLASYTQAGGFAAADPAKLARVVAAPVGLLPGLLRALTPPTGGSQPAIESAAALHRLAECAALAQRLGVGGETLALIGSASYGDLDAAADALRAGIHARFTQAQAAERIEPLQDVLRSRCRDALVDFLIHSSFPQFTTRNDLYQHFLIDVELEGCVRTSRVVSAVSSVQLYVHRVLMNLESDRRAPSDPAHVAVSPGAIPADEWAWRRNYRVWEANRKVFLWPENYLEPHLRDDKSPLFAELETALLQSPVDEQSVLDAYASYLAGFEELAGLQITGSYHDKDPAGRTDVLHLIGVSSADPAVFYHRAVRNAHYGVSETDRGTVWEPWRKIDVQIGSRHVAPIVVRGRLHLFWNEWTTKPKSRIVEGDSVFSAYLHTMAFKCTTLRLDGSWSAPQRMSLQNVYPFISDGIFEETVYSNFTTDLDPLGRTHQEPIEDYRPRGFAYDVVYPGFTDFGRLKVGSVGFQMEAYVDLRTRACADAWDSFDPAEAGLAHVYAYRGGGPRTLSRLTKAYFPSGFDIRSMYLDGNKLDGLRGVAYTPGEFVERDFGPLPILTLPPGANLQLVNGSLSDALIDVAGDVLLLQGSVRPAPGYLLRRVGTTLAPALAETLFLGGVDGLLDTAHQLSLAEAALPVSDLHDVAGDVAAGKVDFTGPYGTYYREIFFHIPYLLANHLSSQQRFGAAQRWYHYLFDPTANETITVPGGVSPAERAHRELDRNWRYREFRGLDVPALRAILTDPQAIEAYQRDPFNPHAIARLRLSSYQKNIVMKYVDNLLDWADSLFAQFTTESINEATLLYATAQAILGERPARLGDCGDGAVVPKTYEAILPLLEKGSQFLAELETTVVGRQGRLKHQQRRDTDELVMSLDDEPEHRRVRNVAAASAASAEQTAAATQDGRKVKGTSEVYGWRRATIARWEPAGTAEQPQLDHILVKNGSSAVAGRFGWSIVTQVSPVFCVPANPELGRRWDRVEEQLFKIRNCLDITGARRQVALFAPEIDPRLLVRARAAGLSLDDVLGATAGNLPPYRFLYLVDRAKAHAALVQSFGSALLGALEKKDVEELTQLRAMQQQNLLKLASQARQWEISAADDAIEVLARQRTAAEYRRDYYQGLADQNLIPSEQQQSDSRIAASGLQKAAGAMDLIAAITHLVPQAGAPTAMKFGGMEVGHSSARFSDVLRTMASMYEADAAAAGLRANFERRREGWLHQTKLIHHELGQLDKQLEAARIRRDIAQRSLELHEASIAQADEVFAFYGEKFTGLGLYTWLASTLQRAYREAYNGAYAMARLAEQAFRFERGDDTSTLLDVSYWDAGRVGLLAGERLLVDLQTMERRFIETNYRTLEVDQAFSLTMLAPQALVKLREKGTCDFSVDEFHLDLLYPGHYRRKVKSVRLTIPCVTGPYTNVSATLTLLGSSLRREPKTAPTAVVEVPLRRSVSIATSTAQQDAGVFEFSFRDERYMPFEGAGAASRWRLTLPSTLRAFDYRTITDVILHVTYTAESEELLRQRMEAPVTEAGSLLHRLKNTPMTRVLSLRHDFSSAYRRLLASPAGTVVPLRMGPEHFPMYLDRKAITPAGVSLALVPRTGHAPGSVTLAVDEVATSQFPPATALGGLPTADVTAAFGASLVGTHTLAVVNPGALGVVDPVPGDVAVIDHDLLEDVLLVLTYTAA
ncbi:neuraminidase-like domain-containing protein [Micromonospora palomenae]|uniref:Tc toxin subunit A-related protein n=1 Tax=Micromonospora palomenae TaxID=1461247 RepID=UPI003F8B4C87